MGAWETGGPATCVGVWLEVAGALVVPGRACVCPCFRMVVWACTCLVTYLERSPTRVSSAWTAIASRAGGIAPLPDYGLHAFPGWHACADPGNKAYSMLCDELLGIEEQPDWPAWCGDGYDLLLQMGKERRGDVVEAALAAADCASAAEQHVADPAGHPAWVRAFHDVVGGGRGQGDMVTDWIQNRLHAAFVHG